jgi:3-hydroxyisobutyrate dehydrogenase-like beta-hydroxyacid dehydrogenase
MNVPNDNLQENDEMMQYQNYGNLIVQKRYEPAGFKLRLGLKDVQLVLGAAESMAVPLPIASLIRDRFLTAIAHGQGEIDWAGLAQVAAENAGLNQQKNRRD